MKTATCLAVAVALAAGASAPGHYHHHGTAVLPDPAITPGAMQTRDTTIICHQATTVRRNVPQARKDSAYVEYGAVKQAGRCCEVDHLIPLELGGSNALTNLWPEPWTPMPAAGEKDEVENWLHGEVCAGRVPVAAAQNVIARDWFFAYKAMVQGTPLPQPEGSPVGARRGRTVRQES